VSVGGQRRTSIVLVETGGELTSAASCTHGGSAQEAGALTWRCSPWRFSEELAKKASPIRWSIPKRQREREHPCFWSHTRSGAASQPATTGAPRSSCQL